MEIERVDEKLIEVFFEKIISIVEPKIEIMRKIINLFPGRKYFNPEKNKNLQRVSKLRDEVRGRLQDSTKFQLFR